MKPRYQWRWPDGKTTKLQWLKKKAGKKPRWRLDPQLVLEDWYREVLPAAVNELQKYVPSVYGFKPNTMKHERKFRIKRLKTG